MVKYGNCLVSLKKELLFILIHIIFILKCILPIFLRSISQKSFLRMASYFHSSASSSSLMPTVLRSLPGVSSPVSTPSSYSNASMPSCSHLYFYGDKIKKAIKIFNTMSSRGTCLKSSKSLLHNSLNSL